MDASGYGNKVSGTRHRLYIFLATTERERFLPSRLTDKVFVDVDVIFRMATDLNLHRKSTIVSADTQNGKALDVEIHNRERTWILCFVLDRSFSSQMGKPHTIREESVTFLFAIVEPLRIDLFSEIVISFDTLRSSTLHLWPMSLTLRYQAMWSV